MTVPQISRTNVTSDDCITDQMLGRFDLAFFASHLARAISLGRRPMVDGFSNSVQHATMVALEELRQKKISFGELINNLSIPLDEQVECEVGKNVQSPETMTIIGNAGYDDHNIDEETDEEIVQKKDEKD